MFNLNYINVFTQGILIQNKLGGHAKNYVYKQSLMRQQDKPEDFVISTGKIITVRVFIEACVLELGWLIGRNS